MKDRARFWLYALFFVFCLNVLAGLFSSWALEAAHNNKGLFVVLAVLVGTAVVVFLALYQHQSLRTERERERVFLQRVAESWVESLTEMQRIAPGAEFIKLECKHLTERPPSITTLKIADEFDDAGRSLIIVGAEGSGKTLSLLVLTRHLVNRAIRKPGQPLPVVLSLSSWNNSAYKANFEKWLLAELKLTYGLSEDQAQKWLVGQRLVLLLDGLDEVNKKERESCSTAIEKFRKDFRPPGIVVASRITKEAPFDGADFPELTRTIEICDLDPNKVKSDSLDSRAIFTYGPNTHLAKLARSPLALILMLAADDEDLKPDITRRDLLAAFINKRLSLSERLDLSDKPDKIRQRLKWLARGMQKHDQAIFYIEGLQPSWLPGQFAYCIASRILSTSLAINFGWIAILTTKHVLGILLPTDKMSFGLGFVVSETPFDWMFIAIIFGGLTMALSDYFRFRKSERDNLITAVKATTTERGDVKRGDLRSISKNVALCGAVFVAGAILMRIAWPKILPLIPVSHWPAWFPAHEFFTFGPWTALSGATVYGISFGLIFWFRGLSRSPRSDIRTAEKVTFTLSKLWSGAWRGALVGFGFGVIPTILVGLMDHGWLYGKRGWIPALYFLPIPVLIGLIVGPVTSGLGKVSVIEKSYPNQGVRLSLRNTILVWLVVGGSAGILIWLYAALFTYLLIRPGVTVYEALAITLQDAVFHGAVVGMLFGLAYGGLDVVYHLTLRVLLALKGLAPLIFLHQFLDNTASIGFLRRVGGGYMFLHLSLREQFEDRQDEAVKTSPPIMLQTQEPKIAGAT
jgi:hypothetical protein